MTARKFDRERQREYAVTVTATDQAADPLIGICQLTIHILDQNDNNPKFENIRYECEKTVQLETHTHSSLNVMSNKQTVAVKTTSPADAHLCPCRLTLKLDRDFSISLHPFCSFCHVLVCIPTVFVIVCCPPRVHKQLSSRFVSDSLQFLCNCPLFFCFCLHDKLICFHEFVLVVK